MRAARSVIIKTGYLLLFVTWNNFIFISSFPTMPFHPISGLEVNGVAGVRSPISGFEPEHVNNAGLTKVEKALYITSCLGMVLLTICCFYFCKHCCWDGCRGEASVTYQQMPPAVITSGSTIIRMSTVGDSEVQSPTMIPMRGMKKPTKSGSAVIPKPPPPMSQESPPAYSSNTKYESFP